MKHKTWNISEVNVEMLGSEALGEKKLLGITGLNQARAVHTNNSDNGLILEFPAF